MARSCVAKVNLQIDATLQNTIGLAGVTGVISRGLLTSLASGVGAGQVDWAYSESNTIVASGNKDYDLSGVLTDAFGVSITFARIKMLAVFADAGNTNLVVVGNAAGTQWPGPFGAVTHTVSVRPGGALIMIAPDATAWPVVGAASDLLRVANSAGSTSVVYDIVVLGCSA